MAISRAAVLSMFSLPVLVDCGGHEPPRETMDPAWPAVNGGVVGASSAGGGGSSGELLNAGGSEASGAGTGGVVVVGGSRATGGAANGETGVESGGVAATGSAGDTGNETGGRTDAGTAGGASSGASGSGGSAIAAGSCETLPPASDYGAPGPFADAKMFAGSGPNNDYTLFRPDASLGMGGFKHPIVTWGNGIATTPDVYEDTLTFLATHGFVIIACNATQAERPCVSAGLDWLISQNDSGPMAGKLDVSRELAVGYSWGGGAVIDASDRPNIKATVSLHGMPPRESDAFAAMHAPLLLFTSTGDTFVSASGYVTPNYEQSTVQTFYATLEDDTAGHLYVADEGAAACLGAALGLGACGNALLERAPTVAWLRYWGCNDQNAKAFFYGEDCVLCRGPWTNPQRKEWQ